MDAPRQFKFSLYGVFRLERLGVGEIVVPSRKARALLAVLALSPRGERARTWLQDSLWSRSEKNEAQASLRRELFGVRRVLGAAADSLLDTGREILRLNLDNCRVDALEDPAPEGAMLLEGLDLPGADGFEDWLSVERQIGRSKSSAALPTANVAGLLQPTSHLLVALHLDIDRGASGTVALVPDMLAQAIAAGLSESGFVRVNILDAAPARPAGPTPSPDIVLRIRATAAGDACWIVIVAQRFSDGILLMSRQDAVGVGGGWSATNGRVGSIASQCVDHLLREALLRPLLQDEQHLARKAVFAAVEQLFSLNPEDVVRGQQTWASVRAVKQNAIFSAWQAYQAVVLADPGHMYNYQLILEECRENMRRALAEEPFNGLVLSLCAHVEAFLFHDFSAAWDLIDRAGLTGTRHVMYYDALSLLRFYTGKYDEARESANQALLTGRSLSFRYAFATSLCMIEGLAGNRDAAIAYGRRALQLEPANRRVSYPPTVRYLGAALAHAGHIDEARSLLERLPEAERSTGSSASGASWNAFPSANGATYMKAALKLIYS
jgi:tetratricopeptide (TPR) repeat protein